MTKTLTMDKPDDRRRLDHMAQAVIGKPLDRPDGPLKVSGTAPYAAEYEIENCAHGVLLRAATMGTVKSLNRAKIEALPGVLGVFSSDEFLRNPAQGMAGEAPVQGVGEVAYVGEVIGLVVAETFEQARHASYAFAPEIEPAGHIVDPEAVEPEPQDSEAVDQGDLAGAMRDASHSVDVVYRTEGHAAAAMEPHASIAVWDGPKLTLYGAYQMLKFNRKELADSLGLDEADVRIVSRYVGGGFGSKLGISQEGIAAAVAARGLGRPVSVVMTRQQVFESIMRRTETKQHMRLAADAEGRLTGLGHESLISNLPDEEFAEPVPQSTHFLYGGENRKISLNVARIHRPAAGSVRAPGEAVGMPVLENAMDELAHAVGIDPVELRKKNLPECHPETGIPFGTRKYAECMDEGAKRFGWADRNRVPGGLREGEWLIGHGMAGASRVNMTETAKARVTLSANGTATVETDMTDIGTGSYTVLGQVAAEMLGLDPAKVEVKLGDTDLPPGSGSGGSIGASSCGSAVFLACEDVRTQICEALGCEEADLTLKDGEAVTGNRRMSLADALGADELTGEGEFNPGETSEDYAQAGYGAYFCEVAVNSVTGETRVRRMLGVYAAGRILNEKTARSQCLGGMTWGIGTALTEELVHDERNGKIVNRDLAEYHVPVNLDVPQLNVVFLEEREDAACPIQSKGIGELGFCGAAGAITNAIYNATGVRVRDYPVTLDKLLAGLPD
ncbi:MULTISPECIES: xanthine dehydrogenase family protein molybdopterin-binding subunit [Pacificimonas]|nr:MULTISPECIES: xanthine dehydrogenase family protein molybdopterin-binding subunit [Pacificimonas]MBZ6378056.1 xanthine dehydrogenase family protein molybdopterin-binding subunit [Pacificimonas aurantium]